MRIPILLASLLVFNSAIGQTDEQTEVQNTIRNMYEEVFSNFSEAAVSEYFTDGLLMFEDGNLLDLTAVSQMADHMKQQHDAEALKGHKLERINRFEFLKTETGCGTATVYYKNSADFLYDGISIAKLNWLESARLEKIGEQWKISFIHSTVIKEN